MISVLVLGVSMMSFHAAERIPAESVEVRGELAVRLERAHARLLQPPLGNPEFVLSDLHFHLTRRFTEYSGDVSGRILGALDASSTVHPGLPLSMEDFLKETIPTLQKADGHFGVEQDLAKSVNQQRDMPILWGNGRLLLALAECCRTKPDEKLLSCARKLGDYIISARSYYGKKENFEGVGGSMASGFTTCYPSWIDGLVALGELTGETKYLDEAAFIARLALLDQIIDKHHSHGRLIAYRGMLDLDRVTGKREFTEAVAEGCARIEKGYLMPVGGVTEIFDLTYDRDEGCSEVDWIRVNTLLWRATGKTHYLDVAENALRNHLMAMQFSNGGFGHHRFGTLKDGKASYLLADVGPDGSEAYWCCTMHGTQLLADIARYAVVTSDDAVWVTWLGEVRAKVKVGGNDIGVTLQKKSPVHWIVSLDNTKQATGVLQLRVPAWTDTLKVDGEKLPAKNGWVDVPLKGTKRTLDVLFTDRIRVTREKEGEAARVYAGPDLYCLPDVEFGKENAPGDQLSTVLLATDVPTSGRRIPVLLETSSGNYQKASLVPIVDRPHGGCSILLKVRNTDPGEWAKLNRDAAPMPKPGVPMKFAFATDGEYEVFLNGVSVYRGAGWQESPEIEVYGKRQNVIAVKVTCQATPPGFIGLIEGKTGTDTQHWSAVPCPEPLSADWVKDMSAGKENEVRLHDLGPLGIEPWKHTPGRFSETEARWIWPEKNTQTDGTKSWLFRYTYKAP